MSLFFTVLFFVILFAGCLSPLFLSAASSRQEARHYADWLTEKYPAHTVGRAAERRRATILSKGYEVSEADKNELRLIELVLEGKHNWDGAVV